jgi:hypothetical protein
MMKESCVGASKESPSVDDCIIRSNIHNNIDNLAFEIKEVAHLVHSLKERLDYVLLSDPLNSLTSKVDEEIIDKLDSRPSDLATHLKDLIGELRESKFELEEILRLLDL